MENKVDQNDVTNIMQEVRGGTVADVGFCSLLTALRFHQDQDNYEI